MKEEGYFQGVLGFSPAREGTTLHWENIALLGLDSGKELREDTPNKVVRGVRRMRWERKGALVLALVAELQEQKGGDSCITGMTRLAQQLGDHM